MKIHAVYTAVIDGYDQLHAPQYVDPDIDYICYTNSLKKSAAPWKLIPVPNIYQNMYGAFGIDQNNIRKKCEEHKLLGRMTARLIKTMPHIFAAKYKVNVWVDGNARIYNLTRAWIDNLLQQKNMWLFRHVGKYRTIFDEARLCIKRKKDRPEAICAQVDEYKQNKQYTPRHIPMTGIIIRKNIPELIAPMCAWWREVATKSIRDQISFDYVMQRYNIQYGMLDDNIRDNTCVVIRGRSHKRNK